MGFQGEFVSTDLSLVIRHDPVVTSSSFSSVSVDLSLAIYPKDNNPSSLTGVVEPVSTDLSLAICPASSVMTSSFTKKQFVVDIDLNVPFVEESPHQEDSAEKTKRCQEKKRRNCETTAKKASSAINKNNDTNMKMMKRRKITKKKTMVERGEDEQPVITSHESLRRFIQEEINGVDLKLVIEKMLYASDLSPTQNRLNMPVNKLKTGEFLTPDEKQFLETHKGNEIEVRLVGPTLQMYMKPMKLKLWHMKSTCNYVLITSWKHFVADNKDHLKKGRKIQVWSFRKDQQLCFAIAIVGR